MVKPTYRIAVLPGDGIGSEVIRAAVDVLRAVERRLADVRFELEELSAGAAEYLRSGDPMPPAVFERCRQCDAILLGAMGLPGVRWRSEERLEGKRVDLGGRRIIKKKK